MPVSVDIKNLRTDKQDNKQIVAPSPAPPRTYTWYTGAGDQITPSIVRGGGTRIKVKIPASETFPKTEPITVQFAEPVYLHDGEINWRPIEDFSCDDEFSVCLNFPATSVVVNESNQGNSVLYEVYPGLHYILPSYDSEGNPNGTHDIDFSKAVPLPSSMGDWKVNKESGVVSRFVEGDDTTTHTKCMLADFAAPSMYLIKPVLMTSVRGMFEIDAYLVEWISQNWTMTMNVIKNAQPTNDVEVSATVMLFRYNASEY